MHSQTRTHTVPAVGITALIWLDGAMRNRTHACIWSVVHAADEEACGDVYRKPWLQVVSMRKQLLALLHVREFATEAAFVDPCRPLVLPAVPCTVCFAVAPLDVTRSHCDAGWRCGACSAPRPAADIEARLHERLRAAVAGGTLCDLRCRRCRALSRGGAERQCPDCGGELEFAGDSGDVRMCATVVGSIARHHEMPGLLEAAEWVANG